MDTKTALNLIKGTRGANNIPIYEETSELSFEMLETETGLKLLDSAKIIAINTVERKVLIGFHTARWVVSKTLIDGRIVVVSEEEVLP